jgi:hypothetical protein
MPPTAMFTIRLNQAFQSLLLFLAANIPDLILIVCLFLSGLKLTGGIETITDIILSDESYYLHNGVDLIQSGFPTAEWAPLYAIWYWLIALVEPSRDHVNLYYFNHKLLVGLTTALLYIALRSINCNRVVAAIVSVVYLLSGIPVIWPRPTHFALLLVLLLIAVQKYFRTELDFYCALGMTLLAISFVRPEYFLAFVVFSVLLAVFIIRKLVTLSAQKPIALRALIYLILALVCLELLGIPTSSGNRSWWAFASHYALRWSWQNQTNLDPWSDYQQITNSVFGTVDTISAAIQANPAAFFNNTLENIKGYFENTVSILAGSLKDYSPALKDLNPTLNTMVRITELALLLIAGIQIIRKRHVLINQIDFRTLRRLLLITLFVELSVVPASFIIFPRYHYLIIHTVLLCVFLAYLCSHTIRDSRWNLNWRQASVLGLLIVLLTPSLANGWCIGNACAFSRPQKPPQPNLETIQFIRSLNLDPPVKLLAFDIEYPIYLGSSYERVDPTQKDTGFSQFIQQNQVDLIVLDQELQQDIRFVDDPEWNRFLQNYSVTGAQRLDIPRTERKLFVLSSGR